jgi:hypothetical protein
LNSLKKRRWKKWAVNELISKELVVNMNKSQLIILLLIIALVFYYLTEVKPSLGGDQNPPPRISPQKPQTLIKKPQSPKPPLTF